MKPTRLLLGALCLALALPGLAQAQERTAAITADAGAAGTHMSDDLYGVFYEDISHAADGGLYAELVQNRSFEFSTVDNNAYNGTTAWTLVNRGDATGTMAVATATPLNAKNLNFLRVTATAPGTTDAAGIAIRNSGFNTGIAVEAGKRYDYSFWARRTGAKDLPIRVAVEDAAGTTTYTEAAATTVTDGAWKQYQGVLTATGSTTTGRVTLVVGGAPTAGTTIDFDMVSLFPQDTFMGRPNGLRKDIAQKIADLEPSFIRFPGGCIVNANSGSGTYGEFPASRSRVYRWQETIGPVEERPTNRNFWGYNQTYGLGFYEYFQFAEDLGAAPLPVVPIGTNSCGGNTRLTTDAQLEPFIQEALNLIQFANGSIATEWGAKRAALGHPAPFNLKYLGMGNEESDPQWNINYPKFSARIRAQYPEIKIVSTTGPSPDGTVFERNWVTSRTERADLVDEHYYPSQAWFLANSHRYDRYDRNGPHVFVGEYAARVTQYDRSFYSALSEAAFMTGIERNSDVIDLASYAPLLANTAYVNWEPDLIYFDNSRVFTTPSYQVQKLFSTNRGDTVVPSRVDAGTATQSPDISGGIGVATWATQSAYDNVKVTAKDGTTLFSDDFASGAGQWTPSGPGGTPRGTWTVTTGEYRQTSNLTDARSIAGSTNWSNYTLELDARKLSGNEGFLIMFGAKDSDNYYWWNLGGFNNTTSVIEKAVGGGKTTIAGSADTVTTGTTYHLKVQVDGRHITTWIDDRKVNDFVDASETVEPLYQVVTRDSETGDVLLKVVNARTSAVTTSVDLGSTPLAATGTVTTMNADALTDANTFANPNKVMPFSEEVSGLGNRFSYEFPAASITFIRLHPGTTPEATAPTVIPTPPAGARPDRLQPRLRLRSNARQSLKRLRTSGLAFKLSADEPVKLTATLVVRGRVVARFSLTRANAQQIATLRLRPSTAQRRRLGQQRRVSALLRVKATDLAGNVTTRTKALSFR